MKYQQLGPELYASFILQIVQRQKPDFEVNNAKNTPKQVFADFGRGRCIEIESG